jgi:hypothetical protein
MDAEVLKIINELALRQRRAVPNGFWKIKEHRVLAINLLLNAIPRHNEEDLFKNIRGMDILYTKYSGLFTNYYHCSLRLMFEELGPEKLDLFLKYKKKHLCSSNE